MILWYNCTLQGTNIYHHGERKIIFNIALKWTILVLRRVHDTMIHMWSPCCFILAMQTGVFEVHGALHNMFKHTFDKPSSSLPPWNLPKISWTHSYQLLAISIPPSNNLPTHSPPPNKKKLKEINTPLAFLSSKDILGNLETLRWSGGLSTFTSLSESQRDLGEPASGGWRWWWRRHLFFYWRFGVKGERWRSNDCR